MIGRKRPVLQRHRGLGQTWKTDSNGNWVDCDLWSNLSVGACWNPFSPARNAEHDAQVYINPTVVPPAAPQTQQQMTQPGAWTPDIAAAATKAAQDAANKAWAEQVAANIAASQAGTLKATGAGAPGAPDCTNMWTYYTNSACPLDCSRFFSNLFNSSCPGLGLGWGTAGILAVAAGVLLLVVVIRR